MRTQQTPARRGSIVPLTAICLVGIIAFMALAIDIGLLIIARNQAQNAADAAAMAGARTLTGDASTNNNYANVQPNATVVAAANKILNQPIDPATQLTLTIGDYYYDTGSASFKINPTGREPGNNWTLVQATITSQRPSVFGQVFGLASLNTSARATAAHRPRDAVIVIDFSGSMRFESLLCAPYFNTRTTSMNPDPVVPTFGHYAGNSAMLSYSTDQQATSGEVISETNLAVPTANAPLAVATRFYGDTTAFGTSTPAFTPAPAAYATTPGGDVPLLANRGSGSTYARTVSEFLGGTTSRDWRFELDGYAAYSGGGVNATTSAASDYSTVGFNGYTQGPGYWGKTFFVWPPDPRVPLTTTYYTSNASLTAPGQIQSIVKQFMLEFGFNATQVNATTANTTNHVWQNWTSFTNETALKSYLTGTLGLSATDPAVLQLLRLHNRAGAGMPANGAGTAVAADWRTRFFRTPSGAPLTDNTRLWSSGAMRVPSSTTYLINYDAILDWIRNCGPNPFPNQLRAGGVVYYTAIPSTINTSTFPPTDPNQRFWKEYIDEVLGVQQTGGSGANPSYSNVARFNGYGADFSWAPVATSGVPAGWPTSTYQSYTDNPQRPKLRLWFGALSLLDYLANYNAADPENNNNPRLWWPGTAPEAPTYQTKLAIQAAIKDTLQNHPNDNLSLIFFSSPRSSATATGYYNYARAPLGRDSRTMINSLWFSPKVIKNNAEISVYDASGQSTGDIYDVPRANGGTCYAMPLMLAYNQFSTNSTLVTHTANAPPGTAGGLGRNGAAKLLVFETDGMVNTGAQGILQSSTNATGYYKVRIADANNYGAAGTEFPTSVGSVTFTTGATQSQTIVQQICNDVSAGGFSTTRKPVVVHCIAFGSLFEPTNTSTSKTNALGNLAALEVIGKVQQPGATTLSSNKIIVGDFATRIANMQTAFNSIMQDGQQVTLLSSGPGQP